MTGERLLMVYIIKLFLLTIISNFERTFMYSGTMRSDMLRHNAKPKGGRIKFLNQAIHQGSPSLAYTFRDLTIKLQFMKIFPLFREYLPQKGSHCLSPKPQEILAPVAAEAFFPVVPWATDTRHHLETTKIEVIHLFCFRNRVDSQRVL